jgi:hypothetical protein
MGMVCCCRLRHRDEELDFTLTKRISPFTILPVYPFHSWEIAEQSTWKRGRVAEGTSLLRKHTGKTCIVGSNPTVSAKTLKPALKRVFLFAISIDGLNRD